MALIQTAHLQIDVEGRSKVSANVCGLFNESNFLAINSQGDGTIKFCDIICLNST